MKSIRLFSFLFFFISLHYCSLAQDSLPIKWAVSSQKIGEGEYEISFRTGLSMGWQLYSPNQHFSDIASTELEFPDSSISLLNPINDSGLSKTITSKIFD